MRASTTKQCSGTTRAGKACQNVIAYANDRQRTWRSGRCGKCTGPPSPAARQTASLNAAFDQSGVKGMVAAVASGESDRPSALKAAIEGMVDRGLRSRYMHGPPGRDYEDEPLPVQEQDLDALLSLAPPGDDAEDVVSAHHALFEHFGVGEDSYRFGAGGRCSPSMKKIVSETRSVSLLNTAARETNRHTFPPREMQDAIVSRLGDLAAAGGHRQAAAVDGLCDFAALFGHDRERLQAVLDAMPGDEDRRRAAELVVADVRSDDGAHGHWRFREPAISGGAAQALAPYHADAAAAAEWAGAPVGQPTTSPARLRCRRYTSSGMQCRNLWTEGKDGDWCGRCDGYPASWAKPPADIGLPKGYLALGEPLQEGARLHHFLSTELNVPAASGFAALEPSFGGWEPIRRFEFDDPAEFTRRCAALAVFACSDEAKPSLGVVGSGEAAGRELLWASDSYRLGFALGRVGPPVTGGTASVAVPAEMVKEADRSGCVIAAAESDGGHCRFALTGPDEKVQHAAEAISRDSWPDQAHSRPSIQAIIAQSDFEMLPDGSPGGETPDNGAVAHIPLGSIRLAAESVAGGEEGTGRYVKLVIGAEDASIVGRSPAGAEGSPPAGDGGLPLDRGEKVRGEPEVWLNPSYLRDFAAAAERMGATPETVVRVGVSSPPNGVVWFGPGGGFGYMQMPVRHGPYD